MGEKHVAHRRVRSLQILTSNFISVHTDRILRWIHQTDQPLSISKKWILIPDRGGQNLTLGILQHSEDFNFTSDKDMEPKILFGDDLY
jgi:hypothetical protein